MGENVFGLTVAQAAERAITAIVRLRADIGLPSRLSGLGVKESDFEVCADDAVGPFAVLRHRRTAPGHPR